MSTNEATTGQGTPGPGSNDPETLFAHIARVDLPAWLSALPAALDDLATHHDAGRSALTPEAFQVAGPPLVADPVTAATWDATSHALSLRIGPARDIELLGAVIYRLAAGNWGTDREHRLAVTGVCGGTWPQGVEAVIRACLHPESPIVDAAALAELIRAVIPAAGMAPGPVMAGRVGLATTVGWSKAAGRGHSDNEDASDFHRDSDVLTAAVLDGVTGPADGSGHWAARTAIDKLITAWEHGDSDPADLAADLALPEPPAHLSGRAATVGVIARVDPNDEHPVRLAVLGDARAYLVTPADGTVVRVTGEGSVVAEELAAGRRPRPGVASVVTTYATVEHVEGPADVSAPTARPEQWLVLLSDGACISDSVDDDWAFADLLGEAARTARSPQHLATVLTVTSEIEGGRDNATALVVELLAAPTDSDTATASRETHPAARPTSLEDVL